MASFKVASLNVRGLREKRKRLTILEWLKKNDVDFALLQETYCNEIIIEKELKK